MSIYTLNWLHPGKIHKLDQSYFLANFPVHSWKKNRAGETLSWNWMQINYVHFSGLEYQLDDSLETHSGRRQIRHALSCMGQSQTSALGVESCWCAQKPRWKVFSVIFFLTSRNSIKNKGTLDSASNDKSCLLTVPKGPRNDTDLPAWGISIDRDDITGQWVSAKIVLHLARWLPTRHKGWWETESIQYVVANPVKCIFLVSQKKFGKCVFQIAYQLYVGTREGDFSSFSCISLK